MVLVAVAMVAIIAMAALSVDVVTLYLANAEAQRSADAAALAAARVLSITGMTGDPNNSSSQWSNICGGANSPASQVATAVATQNAVSGAAASQVTVLYSAAGDPGQANCTGLTGAFGVNPTVTVRVRRTALPTFFSRIWSRTANTVSATATAEAFNPSNSGNVGNTGGSGTIIPVRPRCAKPWILPNLDPTNPVGCTGNCQPFVDPTTAAIQNPGIQSGGSGAGVIGERFTLVADCRPNGKCATNGNPAAQPGANVPATATPNLQYVPGQISSSSTAVPACGDTSGDYMQAIAGCNQNTVYRCGVTQGNTIDLTQKGVPGDTAQGGQCLINQNGGTGQDVLDTSTFPFRIQTGNNSPLKRVGVAKDTFITSSNSIVSVPIFDWSPTKLINTTGTTDVTILGFLQVFINGVDDLGNIDVTVLNVAGCGNGTPPSGNPVAGSSPVPVRLIQKYP